MRNFDEQRKKRTEKDRTFVLGGETFVMVSGVRPEVLAPYDALDLTSGAQNQIEAMDKMILDFLEAGDGAHDRYRALRAREEDPVTIADLEAVITWIVEEQTGRPTGPPGVSMPGQPQTGTPSTAGSSSPVALVASTS